MSTRANINIKINLSDFGAEKVFDAKSQKQIARGYVYCSKKESDDWRKYVEFYERPAVMLEKPYLSIFSHWDGYPGRLGKMLLENYKSYDDVLNLLLGGDIECLHNESIEYAIDVRLDNQPDSDVQSLMPTQGDKPLYEYCYSYTFKDDEWYVEGDYIKKPTLLKKIVADIILGKRDYYGQINK